MVVRKAWLPGHGTYSVETHNDVYNPTIGQVFFCQTEPKDSCDTDEKEHSPEPIIPAAEASAKNALQWYLNIASLANVATVEETVVESSQKSEWTARGAPTEIAIEVFASRFGWNRIQLSQSSNCQWKHIAEFPFDSDVKKMSVIFQETASQKSHVFTKVSTTLKQNNSM